MRTEANKMHKSIPLRKQETHSASLMTDLGLCGQNGLGPPLGHDGQVLFPEPSPPFRQEPLGFDFGGLFPRQKVVFQWIGYRESGKGLEFLPDTASGFERQDVQQSRGFGNDLGPASEPMGKDCVGEGGRIRCRFLAFFKKNVPLPFMLGFLPWDSWQEAQHSLASKTKTLKINRNYEFP